MAHLPYDILFHIFSECILVASQADPSTVIRVSGVCQRWREVAFGVPKLWRTLNLHLPPTSTSTVDGPTLESLQQKAALWLKNSNTELLAITLEYGGHVGLILHLMSFVSSAAHWWDSIHFRGLGNVRIIEGTHHQPDGVITVLSQEGYRFGINEVTWTRSQSTVFLPQIQISTSEHYWKLPMGAFRFYTVLRIDPQSIASNWEQFVDFISSFPSLQRLVVLDGVNDWDSHSPWNDPPRTLRPQATSLRALCLCAFTNTSPFLLLKQLILPYLKSLTIQIAVIPDGFHNYFVARPALTSLCLRRTEISEPELMGMLDVFGSWRRWILGQPEIHYCMSSVPTAMKTELLRNTDSLA